MQLAVEASRNGGGPGAAGFKEPAAPDAAAPSASAGKPSSASTEELELDVVTTAEPRVKLEEPAAVPDPPPDSAVPEMPPDCMDASVPAAAPASAAGPAAPFAAAPAALSPVTAAPHAAPSFPPLDNEPLRVSIDGKERLRWSPQLHARFCAAVEALGGSPFAKPKDIVTKMGVPGLTLAHVKSHLQKYRQQEGVTFVPHSTRGTPHVRRPHHHHQRPSGAVTIPASWPPFTAHGAGGASVGSSDSEEGPPAKCARGMRTSSPGAHELISVEVVQQQTAIGGAMSGGLGAEAATASVMQPLQQYLQSLPPVPQEQQVVVRETTPAPLLAPPQPNPAAVFATAAAPAGTDDELAKLRMLADLATAQLEELAGDGRQLGAGVAAAEAACDALAALPGKPGWAAQQAGSEQRGRLDALLAQHGQLRGAVQSHLQAGARLAAELQAWQRGAQEVLAAAQPQQQQEQAGSAAPVPASAGMVAAAMAALRAAAEQHGGVAPAHAAAEPDMSAAGAPAQLAPLFSVMAAAAARGPGMLPLAPQPAAPPLGPMAGLAQLQQLFQNAAMLASQQQQA